MYPALLILHSLLRWILLLSVVLSVWNACRGLLRNSAFSAFDEWLRKATTVFAHVQLLLGILLYIVSPLVRYFLGNFGEAVHVRDTRYFGMEHPVTMGVVVALLTIGAVRARKKTSSREKFRTIAVWYIIAILIALTAIPWPFSPVAPNRPYFRFF